MMRFVSAIVAMMVWATLCIKLIADPIMDRILASKLDLNHAFLYSWYVCALVILVVIVGAYFILWFVNNRRWDERGGLH